MSILRRFIPLVAAAFTVLPTIASAQAPLSATVQFVGVAPTNPILAGDYVGPYIGDLSGYNPQMGRPGTSLSNAIVWCVDFSHSVNFGPDSYYSTAFKGNVGGIAGNGDFSKTRMGDSTNYKMAAWLIEQYDATGGLDLTFSSTNVQGTIWTLNGATGITGYTSLLSYIPEPGALTLVDNWYVLSDDPCDVYNADEVCTGSADSQEFLHSSPRTVPEPSTYVLMGSGLLGIAGLSRRRRKAAVNV